MTTFAVAGMTMRKQRRQCCHSGGIVEPDRIHAVFSLKAVWTLSVVATPSRVTKCKKSRVRDFSLFHSRGNRNFFHLHESYPREAAPG